MRITVSARHMSIPDKRRARRSSCRSISGCAPSTWPNWINSERKFDNSFIRQRMASAQNNDHVGKSRTQLADFLQPSRIPARCGGCDDGEHVIAVVVGAVSGVLEIEEGHCRYIRGR